MARPCCLNARCQLAEGAVMWRIDFSSEPFSVTLRSDDSFTAEGMDTLVRQFGDILRESARVVFELGDDKP